jgi:hypothetical protein
LTDQQARQSHTELVAAIFRNAGFGVTMKHEGFLVHLKNRFVSTNSVQLLLIQEDLDELCTVTYSNFYKGPIVTIN